MCFFVVLIIGCISAVWNLYTTKIKCIYTFKIVL